MEILTAVLIVSLIGLVLGLGLAFASIVFAVPEDETAAAVRECLPGANCGACGFSGCDGYAAALSEGKTDNCALCTPGGNEVASAVAEVMGVQAQAVTPMTAVVMCCGYSENAQNKLEYSGIHSCRAATQIFGGAKKCTWGCIGFGDCVKQCEYNAIFICDGVARVNPNACHACQKCVKACPRGLIDMFPLEKAAAAVMCVNREKGAQTRKQCSAGCIGCMRCVKACEYGAVTVSSFVAKVDYEKCVGCGKCAQACPVGCIKLLELQKAKA